MRDVSPAYVGFGSFSSDRPASDALGMSASPRSRPNPRTAAIRRGGRVEDGRGSWGHAATLRFPSPLIEPDVERKDMPAQLANESFRAGYVRFGNSVGAVVQVLLRSDAPARPP